MKANDHVAAHVNGLKSAIHAVEVQLTILKQLVGPSKKTTAREETEEAEETDETEETETDETEQDDAEESEESDEDTEQDDAEESDEDEADEKPAKKTSGKVTAEQLNDACKARLQKLIKVKKLTSKKAFAAVKALLQKHFDTESVAQIEKADRAKALKLLQTPIK